MRQPLACIVLLLAACGPKSDGASGSDDGGATATASTDGSTTAGGTGTSVAGSDSGPSKPGEDCPDPHSYLSNDECFCDPGYTWCTPDDPNDLTCCSLTDPTTGSDPATDSAATTAAATSSAPDTGDVTTAAPDTGDGTTAAPDACDLTPPAECRPGATFCDHEVGCGPQGSTYFECQDGGFVPVPDAPDAGCKADGFDFAYGCTNTDDGPQFLCGTGPGTPCVEGDPEFCSDETTLQFCEFGKLGDLDCKKHCQEIGDGNGGTFDSGFCLQKRIDTDCMCCNKGEPGCPA